MYYHITGYIDLVISVFFLLKVYFFWPRDQNASMASEHLGSIFPWPGVARSGQEVSTRLTLATTHQGSFATSLNTRPQPDLKKYLSRDRFCY